MMSQEVNLQGRNEKWINGLPDDLLINEQKIKTNKL